MKIREIFPLVTCIKRIFTLQGKMIKVKFIENKILHTVAVRSVSAKKKKFVSVYSCLNPFSNFSLDLTNLGSDRINQITRKSLEFGIVLLKVII